MIPFLQAVLLRANKNAFYKVALLSAIQDGACILSMHCMPDSSSQIYGTRILWITVSSDTCPRFAAPVWKKRDHKQTSREYGPTAKILMPVYLQFGKHGKSRRCLDNS